MEMQVKEVLTTNLKLSDEELQKFKELWHEAVSNLNYTHASACVGPIERTGERRKRG